MKSKPYKKQHYVPIVYLKSWTNSDNLVNTYNLKDDITRRQKPNNIMKKKNLYTQKDGKDDFGKQIVERFFVGYNETNWNDILEAINTHEILNNELLIGQLFWFVSTLSIRTPKFANDFKKEIQARQGEEEVQKIPDSKLLGALIAYNSMNIGFNATGVILESASIQNFITCDNPATHWFKRGTQQAIIKAPNFRNDLAKNPNYEIMCPLSPRHLLLMRPNIDIPLKKGATRIRIEKIYDSTILEYNNLIEMGADKLLVYKSPTDLPVYIEQKLIRP